MKHEKTTCDVCGVVKGAEYSGPHPISPYVWFTISRNGHARGIYPLPRMSMSPDAPDLCSWKCVAAFATERTERAVRAEAVDAEKAAAITELDSR